MRAILAGMGVVLAMSTAPGEPVAYWRFEDNGDSVANAKDFALDVSSSVDFSSDVPGAEIEADGKKLPNRFSYHNGASVDGSSFAASEVLDRLMGQESFTIEGFLKLDDRTGEEKYMRVIGNSSYEGNPGGWSISISSGRLIFGALQGLGTVEGTEPGTLTSKTVLSENKWHHFAVVGLRNSERLVVRLFIDGEESEVERAQNFYPANQGDNAILPTADRYLISSKNIFKGYLDEIRISDTALDPSEFLIAKP
jgi:hypothetical protein